MQKTLTLFLTLIFICGFSQNTTPKTTTSRSLNSIEHAIQNLQKDKQIQNASFSFYVYDMDNNMEIANTNAQHTMPSASTMKIITTASALQILGSYAKFETGLYYDGYIDTNCTLHGNIYIRGGGDPTLFSKYFNKKGTDPMQDWVVAIENLGIHHIEGRIIGDASYFPDEYVPANWSWGDMGNYYGAGVSGLTIYDNSLRLYFDAGSENNDSTVLECYEPYTPDLFIDNRVKAGNTKKDLAYIYGGPYDTYRKVEGRIPKGAQHFEVKGSLHDPSYVAAFELETKLWQHDISISAPASTVRKIKLFEHHIIDRKTQHNFYKHSSPSVAKIVYWTNLISNNLFAETLLRQIGVKKYQQGSVFSSTLAIKKYWTSKGLDMTGFYQNDGSGLTRANAISAKHLVDVLVYMKTKSKYSKSFVSSLPIAVKQAH